MLIRQLLKLFQTRSLLRSTINYRFAENQGTDYSNWALARAAGHNHNISHLKRRLPKDRFSIHRLTNLSFMMDIINFKNKYNLNQNQKIILLAQINHVISVVGKNRSNYMLQIMLLYSDIIKELQNPPDLPCIGTLMSSLVTMSLYSEGAWTTLVDCIEANKFDQDYDELFGIVIGLMRYKQNLKEYNNYFLISKDHVSPQIPIIYRNSLDVLRQFVTQNIYNLKECRLLFEALYQANINQSYFWNSVRDWFNIYTKEQLGKKHMDQYFIMKQSAVEKVLHDHGIIRPRPILQELSSIVFILSQFGSTSWRFIEFAQDLILYAIDHGSSLYSNFKEISAKEQALFAAEEEKITLNQHLKISKQAEKEKVKQMQKKYRTIFLNPISLKNNFIVSLLVVLSRAYKKYDQPIKRQMSQTEQQQKAHNFYDKNENIYLDPKVKKWILLQLVKPQMQYTVKQLLHINRCGQFLKDSHINLEVLIAEKLQNLRQTDATFVQIQKLMEIIPSIHYDKMSIVLADFLIRNHPSQILLMAKLIEHKNLFAYMPQFMMRLPKAINKHEKYFSFEENCYFLLMLLQNAEAISTLSTKPQLKMEYDGQMQQLKQSLKIITYSRGFKLTVNSYFHKLMDYIDVVQFFEGGRL